ncbi:Protein of uncharacterised function (DUF1631) [Delftia tsuruhatensis]|uniref:DUF1631 family protein n=1 Tax=Delftia tsuruhatensis TaxID=180282 RepID=UPI001E705307|nr:DUF1631 family protein [Delftia tsuruhatensis]CAB5700793.1 Protein of uncharacterised function (DUF1631) [Delftia tsuruhatensis]CAC9693453.1 Protein of uncharacterised function (DUF1631) [Delftia tsuruhatensis]
MSSLPTSSNAPAGPQSALGQQARLHWIRGLCKGLPSVAAQLQAQMEQQAQAVGTQREMQERREAWANYCQRQAAWLSGGTQALQGALLPGKAAPAPAPQRGALQFELLSDDVVENKILASRMALAMGETTAPAFDTLRLRMQLLEDRELPSDDILRSESVCRHLVEQWLQAGLQRGDLQRVLDLLQAALAPLLAAGYQAAHVLLDGQGVTRSQDVAMRVRRTEAGHSTRAMGLGSPTAPGPSATPSSGHVPVQMGSGPAPSSFATPPLGQMPVGLTTLARARHRAHEVVGQLRRLLMQPGVGMAGLVPGVGGTAPQAPASAALAQALLEQRVVAQTQYQQMLAQGLTTLHIDASPAAIGHLVGQVRERSADLKRKAATPGEKATIEIVALMFQAILTEDRIPPSVRVWFARLQVPVLRVALAEPDFFSNLRHPARLLIDRLGSCVMGFDASSIGGSALESEIRRIVQVIEQYPETGQKVFVLVLREFEDFLARYLTQSQDKAKIVSVAQQVEQKETLAIQYTIELRHLLTDMPVREEIREFLFKTWTEVLALAAVRHGAKDARTMRFKQAASELVWAASAKPTRQERSRVIQTLPTLLQTLREGLALIGTTGDAQSARIKQVTDTLAEAFVSKTATIAPARIEAMAQRLAHLEQYISEDGSLDEDMPLSPENIEMILGVDTAGLNVIPSTNTPVEPVMLEWATSLEPGRWFTLDHNGARIQVQYAWRSRRKQLHLFAALDGTCHLLQLRRMASYLQSGLLSVHDEEALTVRATRDALQKIQANPERLSAP